MEKCSKCLTDAYSLVKYTDLNENWGLCRLCNSAFDQKAFLFSEFMKDDFGSFPVSRISKEIILSRIERAKGRGAWTIENGDNKGELF
jgi:hypothetical protein